jgi:hypothetical protein
MATYASFMQPIILQKPAILMITYRLSPHSPPIVPLLSQGLSEGFTEGISQGFSQGMSKGLG